MTSSIGAVNATATFVPEHDDALLPAIEAVATGGLAPPDGGSDEPEEGKDHRGDPKDVEGKTGPREDQHNEEDKKQDHAGIVPLDPGVKREGQRVWTETGMHPRLGPR
jgi:hypothetical protein